MQSTAPLRICCPFDPAIDPSKSDTTAYAMWHDPEDIVELPGQHIVWFTCRKLRRSQVAFLESTIFGEKARYIQAFMMSVTRAENLPIGDGEALATWEPGWYQRDPADAAGKMTVEETDLFDVDEQIEIGYVVYRASGFFRRGRPVFWRPQPWCVDAVAELPYHHAAKIRASYVRRREERLAQPSQTNGDGSEPPTDATAKVE